MSACEAAGLIESGSLLLDVREPNEWEAGHVEGALFIPMGEVGARLDELPKDRRVVVICRSGGRSGAVTEALNGLGFDAVNLEGGITAWVAEELPIVNAQGGEGAVV